MSALVNLLSRAVEAIGCAMAAICRLRLDLRTKAYAARRAADGLSKRDIIRCLKRQSPARPTTCSPSPALDEHESVQGSQFVSLGFGQACAKAGIARSMGSRGDCWDNALAETFFALLKKELINRCSWPSRAELRTAVFDYIELFYNTRRRHSTLGMLAPARFEEQRRSDLTDKINS